MRLTTFWAQGLPLVLHYYWTVVEVLNPEPLVKVLLASTVQEAPPRILLLPTPTSQQHTPYQPFPPHQSMPPYHRTPPGPFAQADHIDD
jgi:hypothetical protein